jgi:hypothetical protein
MKQHMVGVNVASANINGVTLQPGVKAAPNNPKNHN